MYYLYILFGLTYIIGSYLLGAIPTSAIIAKYKGGFDLTRQGSGNLGATNVARIIGKKFGAITLVLDALKGFIPVFTAVKLLHFQGLILIPLIALPVVGHCYSIYINFKGGKGVATALGAFMGISPLAVIVAAVIFFAIVFTSKYVSLASIVSAFFMPFIMFYFNEDIFVFIGALLVAALIIYKHSANIKRLMEGTEHRFSR